MVYQMIWPKKETSLQNAQKQNAQDNKKPKFRKFRKLQFFGSFELFLCLFELIAAALRLEIVLT